MTETMETWIKRVGSWTLLSRVSLLLGVFAAYLLLVAPVAWWLDGFRGVVAAGFATLICFVSGLLALVVTSLVATPDRAATHAVLGMFIRMSLPLLACLIITQRESDLTAVGFAWYLVGAFCVGLFVETAMSLGQIKSYNGS